MKGYLMLYDKDKNSLKRIALIKLPLKKIYISKKSEELYSEPDPCIIYETAIINRFGLELHKRAQGENLLNKMFTLEELDEILDSCVDFPGDVHFGMFV